MSHAFQTIKGRDDVPLLIFGDHASRFIPAAYEGLGLSGDDLERHIAWDIGTQTVIRALCERFGAAGHICGFSRLLIDANRAPHAAGLIPAVSDGTKVPANANVTPQDRAARMAEFYTPYHSALSAAVEDLKTAHKDPFILSVHSFTPQPITSDQHRPMDAALLVKHDTHTAAAFMALAAKHWPHYDCRINEPYSAYDLNYTVDTHISTLRHLAIEIRQDHIETKEKAEAFAETFGNILSALF